jgi:hypothetical protein
MSSSCRKFYFLIGAGALIGLTPGVRADNWEFLPRIEGGATYNDNYRLAETGEDKIAVYGPYIDAQLNAQIVGPSGSKLEIVPRVRSTFFPTDHADQSTDGYLDFDGEYKTLRSDFTAIGQYANETVIYSELLPATFPGLALGQVVPAQSGRVSISNREQLARFAPNYIYDLTQRLHLNLGGEYDRASFNHSEVEQVGYSNYTGIAGLGFDVSERSVFTVTGVGSRFLPEEGGHDTDTYGVNLQWDLRESQIAHYYVRVGANRSRSDGTFTTASTVTQPGPGSSVTAVTTTTTTNETVDTNGITGGAGMDLRYQVTEVTLDVLRALAPSDAGAQVITNEARFRVLHAFAPRFSGFVGVRGIQVRGSSSRVGLTIQGENYVAAETGLDYQITQNYRVEGKYYYTWQRFQGEPNANSNAVGLAIIYQPLSRYEPLPELTGIPQER